MSLPCCAAKVITWSRPLRLARYIAQSALSMSSSLKVASAGHVAMPMLTDSGSVPARRAHREDTGADALGHLQGAALVGVEQDGGELLAAVAGREVDVAHRALDHAGDGAQHAVAGAVPVQLVEGVEVVEVAEEQRQPLGLVGAAVELLPRAARGSSDGCRGR